MHCTGTFKDNPSFSLHKKNTLKHYVRPYIGDNPPCLLKKPNVGHCDVLAAIILFHPLSYFQEINLVNQECPLCRQGCYWLLHSKHILKIISLFLFQDFPFFQTYNFRFNIMTNVAKVISIDWWQKLCRWLPPLRFATALNSSVCHNFHFPKTVAAAFHRKRQSHQKHRFSKLSFALSSQQIQLFAIKQDWKSVQRCATESWKF